jgi:hypothetical protein
MELLTTNEGSKQMNMIEDNKKTRRLIPASQWRKYHSWPPLGGLRHLIFNARFNGFNRVIRKIGRSVLIDEDEFFRWIDEHKIETPGKL